MEKKDTLLTILGLDKNVGSTTDAYEQFKTLKEVQEILDEKSKALRTILFDLAEVAGLRDEKGSFTVAFEDGTGYQKQARTSMKLRLAETMEYLKAHNIEGVIEKELILPKDKEQREELMTFLIEKFPELLEEEETVNEGYLEQAVLSGDVPMEDFEKLVDRKVIYALIDLDKKKK